MDRYVNDDGHDDAVMLIVGEAPGKDEMAARYPFAGESGRMLRRWFLECGLRRSDAYITNVLGSIPPAPRGDIDASLKSKGISPDDIRAGHEYVQAIAERLPKLSVICPIGNYAAFGFSPGGKVRFDQSRPGISSIRGSVYPYVVGEGRTVSVVPTIHPAAVMRRPVWEKRCIRDWKRIASLIGKPYSPPPARHHIINPSVSDIHKWLDGFDSKRHTMSLDIETWGDAIQCIGFAYDRYESITIPTTSQYWGDGADWHEVWDVVTTIVEDPDIILTMQNGLFDSWWLTHYGLTVRGYVWDTLAMHHAIDPVDEHSLDHMASLFTWQPYWKDEAKQADEIVKIANDVGIDRLYVYNGIDVTVTLELKEVFLEMLERRGMVGFYHRHYSSMHDVLLGMMQRGIGCNRQKMTAMWHDYLMTSRRLRDAASKLAGRPLYNFKSTKCERDMLELYEVDQAWCSDEEWEDPDIQIFPSIKDNLIKKGHKPAQIHAKWDALAKKQLSDTEVGKLLYNEWNAPKVSKTPTGKWQVDNVALKTTKHRAEARVRLPRKDDIIEMVDLVIDHRRAAKLGSFLNPTRLDSDDRMRCEYRFATRSGRLSSRENPRGTGSNLQNYDRDLLSIFIPRPNHVIVEVDLSQAESRVVNCLTGDAQMIEIARRHPADFDAHRHNAVTIFSRIIGRLLLIEEITYIQRQLGKRVVHATNYAMGANELSRTILRETGDAMTKLECEAMLAAQLEANPQILVYQSTVRRAILAHEQLYTSWGRLVDMSNIRKDDDLYKFGYSYIPQSEIGDLTNQWGLKPLNTWITKNQLDAEIIGQKHDSIAVDCLPEEAWYVMNCLELNLSRERRYGRALGLDIPLSIPCEFAVGRSWKMEKEWKRLPDRQEVEDVCNEMLLKAA